MLGYKVAGHPNTTKRKVRTAYYNGRQYRVMRYPSPVPARGLDTIADVATSYLPFVDRKHWYLRVWIQ